MSYSSSSSSLNTIQDATSSSTQDSSSMGVTMEYDYLAVFYALLATVAFVQLIRIQQRNSSVWTTQKSFVVLNFLVMSIRAVVFAIRGKLDEIEPNVIASILLDLPGLIFFTTCASFLLFSFGRGTNDFFLFFSLIEKRKRRNKNHHNRTRIKKTLQNKILT
jgi:hypothetical protein